LASGYWHAAQSMRFFEGNATAKTSGRQQT